RYPKAGQSHHWYQGLWLGVSQRTRPSPPQHSKHGTQFTPNRRLCRIRHPLYTLLRTSRLKRDENGSTVTAATATKSKARTLPSIPSTSTSRDERRISTTDRPLSSHVTSRTSSPTKQSRRLALEADGLVHREFPRSRDDLPPSLARLVKELQDINRAFQLIPQDMRSEYAGLDIPDYAFSEEREPGISEFRFPPRGLVAGLLDQGEDCKLNILGESGWNTELHLLMMDWALRPND
ncbi:hypothetical protein RB213_001171, partial [Colletotrichum asianum]